MLTYVLQYCENIGLFLPIRKSEAVLEGIFVWRCLAITTIHELIIKMLSRCHSYFSKEENVIVLFVHPTRKKRMEGDDPLSDEGLNKGVKLRLRLCLRVKDLHSFHTRSIDQASIRREQN